MQEKNPRDEAQLRAFEMLRDRRRVILNWGTGTGKSRVAINFLDWYETDNESGRFLLLVDQTAHKNNWRDEFIEALGEERASELLRRTTIECYASFKNHSDTQWNVIIFDEAHHLITDLRTETLSTLRSDYVLCLSATLNENGDADGLLQTMNRTFGEFTTLTITLQDAIDNKILPEPRFIIHQLFMPDHVKKTYEEFERTIARKYGQYEELKKKAGLDMKTHLETAESDKAKDAFLRACNDRKDYMANLKTGVAKEIIRQLADEGKRFVVFCNSIDQAEAVGGSENVICNKKTKKENDLIIEEFNCGERNSLFAVDMGKEGMNFRGIETGLIIQLDNKSRPNVQRFGRYMRAEKPEIHLLVIPGTQDETYMQRTLQGIDPSFIEGWNPQKTEEKKHYTPKQPDRPAPARQQSPIHLAKVTGTQFTVNDPQGRNTKATSLQGQLQGIAERNDTGRVAFILKNGPDTILLGMNRTECLPTLRRLNSCPDLRGKTIRFSLQPNGFLDIYANDISLGQTVSGKYRNREDETRALIEKINQNFKK